MENEKEVWTLIQKLQQDPNTYDTFIWKNDPLWYKDCLYLCKNSQLRKNILLELHTSPLRGHSGFFKNLPQGQEVFFWDGIKYDIQKFCGRMFGFSTK